MRNIDFALSFALNSTLVGCCFCFQDYAFKKEPQFHKETAISLKEITTEN